MSLIQLSIVDVTFISDYALFLLNPMPSSIVRSHEAVRVNRQLIGQDQVEYQREIERNFAQIKGQMEPYLKPLESQCQIISTFSND